MAARPASIACAITSVATRLTRLAGVTLRFRALVEALVFLVARFFDALFFRAEPLLLVAEVRFLEAVRVFFAAAARFRDVVLFFDVARFRDVVPFFDVERDVVLLLRPALRVLVALRAAGFRPADFVLGLPRDDFLVVAIHVLRVRR